MDRRDALKKLGMGGVTIVGASMVVSSPAFGATEPVDPTPGVTMTTPDKVATFSYTLALPTCTGGSDPNPDVAVVSAELTANNGSINGLQLTATGGGQDPKFKQGDTATLTVNTLSTCTYSNATETPVPEQYVFVFNWVPNSSTFVLQP